MIIVQYLSVGYKLHICNSQVLISIKHIVSTENEMKRNKAKRLHYFFVYRHHCTTSKSPKGSPHIPLDK